MRATLLFLTVVAVLASLSTALPIQLNAYPLMALRQLINGAPIMVPGPEIKVPSHSSTPIKTNATAARIKRLGVKKAVKPLPGTANYVSNPRPPKGHLRPSTLGELPISINSNKDPRFVLYGDLYFQDDTFGVPPVNKVKGFTHYNVAFWMATSGPADNALAWTQATDEQRKKIKKAYNDAVSAGARRRAHRHLEADRNIFPPTTRARRASSSWSPPLVQPTLLRRALV